MYFKRCCLNFEMLQVPWLSEILILMFCFFFLLFFVEGRACFVLFRVRKVTQKISSGFLKWAMLFNLLINSAEEFSFV